MRVNLLVVILFLLLPLQKNSFCELLDCFLSLSGLEMIVYGSISPPMKTSSFLLCLHYLSHQKRVCSASCTVSTQFTHFGSASFPNLCRYMLHISDQQLHQVEVSVPELPRHLLFDVSYEPVCPTILVSGIPLEFP